MASTGVFFERSKYMSKTFKQGNYNPVHGISMKLSGCGPCASASVLCNLDGSIHLARPAPALLMYCKNMVWKCLVTTSRNIRAVQLGSRPWQRCRVFLVTGGPSFSRLENPMVPKTISGPVAAITCQQLI